MKKINYTNLLAVLAFLCTGLVLHAQPANDICAAAQPISSGQTISGTTTGATVDAGLTPCNTSITAPGVWYFVIGNGGLLTASTCNQAAYDTKITIFSGGAGCSNLTCVADNDDASGCTGLTSEASALTQAGGFYYILVHGFSSNTGNFDLTATLGAPPVGNDACGGALPISCGQTVTGTTVGSTPDNAPTCTTTNTSPGVWYQFVGTGAPTTVSLCSGTSYDSKVSVYSGSCGALTCVGGNDDFCGLQSEVTINTMASQTYYVLVHGFGQNTGAYSLTIDCLTLPTNDAPCNADALVFGNNDYNHIQLSADTNEVSPGAGTGSSSCNSTDGWCSFELDLDNTAWFTFVAPAGGSVNVVSDGTGFDSQIAVYSVTDCNDYGTFTLVGANDDSGDDIVSNTQSIFGGGLTLNCLNAGETYYVQVDGYNGDEAVGATVILEDNGGSLPSVDAGECQSTYMGYAPVMGDTNFLVATASGMGPFLMEWSVVSGDTNILYSDMTSDSTLGLAVQPNQTTVYEVTVTDSRGCTVTAQTSVEAVNVACFNGVQMCFDPSNDGQAIVLDWETDGNNTALPAGTQITNQYANLGINITANNNNGPDAAVIFDSSNPTGGDWDLGTPNSDFGGPGLGTGGRAGMQGANSVAENNILIIQERSQMCGNVFCTPDDDLDGGTITFDFDDPYTVETIKIVDADDGNPSMAVVTIDANSGSYSINVPDLGNNSVATIPIFEDLVYSMTITFEGSGGLADVKLRREQGTFCAASADVAGLLADGDYHLGTCNDNCLATNPAFDPAPSCVPLIVNVLTDNFGSETSWEVIDLTNSQTVGTRDYTFGDNNLTTADTFCVDPRHCYDVIITDAFGDGMCCLFGNGTWSVEYDGVLTPSPTNGDYGSSETISVGNCSSKGTEGQAVAAELEEMKVSVYPNPASDLTHVKFSSPTSGQVNVSLFNLQGQNVATIFNGEAAAGEVYLLDVNTSELPAGVYVFRVAGIDQVYTGKLQITH